MTYPRARSPYLCCEHCPWLMPEGHSAPCMECSIPGLQTPPRPATLEVNNDPEEDNMANFINRIDIKRGDTIRVTREFRVTDVSPTSLGGTTSFEHDGKGMGRVHLNDQAQIELVNRPLNLPTRIGSFVEVTLLGYGKNDDRRVGHWLLTIHNGISRWVSASRVNKTPEEFEDFLSAKGVQFEVIR